MKQYSKVDYSIFEATLTALDMKPTPLCQLLGYHGVAWSNWKKEGKIPKVAGLACEGLRRRNGASDKVLLIHTASQPQRDMLRTVAKGLGLEVKEI